VVCEWNYVTARFGLLVDSETSTVYEGYVFVDFTAQYVGVDGLDNAAAGLTAWDPVSRPIAADGITR
jgi:hypothetical protein